MLNYKIQRSSVGGVISLWIVLGCFHLWWQPKLKTNAAFVKKINQINGIPTQIDWNILNIAHKLSLSFFKENLITKEELRTKFDFKMCSSVVHRQSCVSIILLNFKMKIFLGWALTCNSFVPNPLDRSFYCASLRIQKCV